MARNERASVFERWSRVATHAAGSTPALLIAFGTLVVWGLTGPLFGFSDTWQLVINTGTTIITFLMVFLIQRSQNKDALAIQLKLNEIVAALPKASNHLIDAEDFDEQQLEVLHRHYRELAALAVHDAPLDQSHSVGRAHTRAASKRHQHASGDAEPVARPPADLAE